MVSKSSSQNNKSWKYGVVSVNALAGFGIMIAAGGAQCHLNQIVSASEIMTLLQIFFIMLINFLGNSMAPIRFLFFIGLCFCAGVNTGSWIYSALQESGFCYGNGMIYFPDVDFLGGMFLSKGQYLKICQPSILSPLVVEAFLMTLGSYAAITIISLPALPLLKILHD